MNRLRILLVDDEEMMRTAVRAMLEHFGHEVTVAGNGHEALAAQKANPAAILLTDLFMPEKEGIETIREFRKTYPSVRIIAMSGGSPGAATSKEEYLLMARRMGADRFIAKPFKPQELEIAIAEAAALVAR